MIIGVTGMYASGKDTIAQHLEKKGFLHYSLSDEIREEAKRRKIAVTRNNLINLANELRNKFGPRILADRVRIKMRLHPSKDYVVTSIRNPEETRSLQEESDFILIAASADPKLRFEWLKLRAREEDPKTFREFVEKEKIEQSADPTKQQLHKVISQAKIVLHNEGTIEELQRKADKMLLDLRKKFQKPRPSWDEYFINITREVAKRATCLRGKIGVAIVKDKRIIATGYNGSPRGLPHCTEVGCRIWKTIDENGKEEQRCLRTVHGEMNAIAQAAVHGVSTEGATLYGTYKPCNVCMKLIINAGIKKVICEKNYHDGLTDELAKEARVPLIIYEPDRDSLETVR